jgi:cell division protein FtsB
MLSTLSGRIVFLIAVLLLLLLQYKLWWGESGYYDRQAMQQHIEAQRLDNAKLLERNRILSAEVYDLKSGMEAVEEHARLDLGLIKPNETFVQMSTLAAEKYREQYREQELQGDTARVDEDAQTNESP